jgi:hypothetical protein
LRFVSLLFSALVVLAGASAPPKSILVFTPDDPTMPGMAAIGETTR